MARPLSAATVRAVIVAAFVIASMALAPLSSRAAEGDTVTWSLTPANSDGADGRAVIERSVDPGDSFQDFVQLKNFSPEPVTFTLEAADGYYTDTSRFAMRERGQSSSDLGTWISIPDDVMVGAGSTAVVPFTVTVPGDALPGDHLAGIAASISSASTGTADNGRISVDARVGVAVALHVTGELRTEVTSTLSAEYITNINPFSPGSLALTYTVRNTGNTVVALIGAIATSGPFGVLPGGGPIESIDRLGPGEQRTGSLTVENVWPSFITKAALAVSAATVGESVPQTSRNIGATSTASPPYPQAAVLAVGGGLVMLFVLDRRRQRRKITAAVNEARRQEPEDRRSRPR